MQESISSFIFQEMTSVHGVLIAGISKQH